MVALGAQGIKSEDDVAGFEKPKPGRYHVFVQDVEEEKTNKVIVDFEILEGTVPDQKGRRVREYFATSEKALPRLQRLALVLGLLKPGAPETDIVFTRGIRKQLVVEVEDNEYEKEGKTVKGVRIKYLGMWSLGNKEVADVPKDKDAIANGVKASDEEAVAVGATSGDDFGDL